MKNGDVKPPLILEKNRSKRDLLFLILRTIPTNFYNHLSGNWKRTKQSSDAEGGSF